MRVCTGNEWLHFWWRLLWQRRVVHCWDWNREIGQFISVLNMVIISERGITMNKNKYIDTDSSIGWTPAQIYKYQSEHTWTIDGLCKKISNGKSRKMTSNKKAQAFLTRGMLGEQSDVHVEVRTCLSVPVRDCQGKPLKLKHSVTSSSHRSTGSGVSITWI